MLAFFPLTALFVLGFSAFLDPDTVRSIATEVFTFYFPGAEQFLSHTIDHLYAQQLLASILSIGAIAIGALGLFVAANRGVNRLFGRPPKRLYGTTISTVAISSLAVILFLGSMDSSFPYNHSSTPNRHYHLGSGSYVHRGDCVRRRSEAFPESTY